MKRIINALIKEFEDDPIGAVLLTCVLVCVTGLTLLLLSLPVVAIVDSVTNDSQPTLGECQ